MNYRAWKQDVPQYITDDPLWRVKVYRLALFAADVGWQDVTKLIEETRTKGLSDQLYRALVLSVLTLLKDTVEVRNVIGQDSMNTHLVLHEKAATGILKHGTYYPRMFWSIAIRC